VRNKEALCLSSVNTRASEKNFFARIRRPNNVNGARGGLQESGVVVVAVVADKRIEMNGTWWSGGQMSGAEVHKFSKENANADLKQSDEILR
jgi:hypothetical protein